MRELSVFVDESGEMGRQSKYYVLTLVFHDQSASLDDVLLPYEIDLQNRGLPDIPFHASPLINGKRDYANLDFQTRKAFLSTFLVLFRHLPISYVMFLYNKKKIGASSLLADQMCKDLSGYIKRQLEYFQPFDIVKVYYDNGQHSVTCALRGAFEQALSKRVVHYRRARPADYRLSQVADLICTIELTACKYAHHEETETDRKFFGPWRTFKKNVLKDVRAKRMQ